MSNPNRVSGGKKGKTDGHRNEELVAALLAESKETQKTTMIRVGKPASKVDSVVVGGIHEKSVPGVIRKKTKLKSDLKLRLKAEAESINFSVKKGLEDQAYLVKCAIFIDLFEKSFGSIDDDVKKALKLFWYADTTHAVEIINSVATENKDLQLKHKSLNADTLKLYDKDLYAKLLQWFKDNIDKITELVFARGDVAAANDWAQYLWYKNLLGDHKEDDIFPISEICKRSKENTDMITYGSKNGGTTIHLPFGKVQWHKRSMQFRHDYKKIKSLMKKEGEQ